MTESTDPFKEIRPYYDHEIRPVLDKLMSDPEFIGSIASFYFPRLSKIVPPLPNFLARKKLQSQVKNVTDVASMQDVIAVYMDKMIEDTTTELTHSGMENLKADNSYLFICNHRDIVMDPAFVNYVLYHANLPTLQIAIGDNLLKKPFVSDLMRLNKSFIVKRSLTGRELLKALTQLSRYIAHCIADKQNVWIAQKEGRAKDGIDKTDPTLLKMLAMAQRGQAIGATLENLHIVPVSISYEYDACDELKAKELYLKETPQGFSKSEDSDVESIVTGMIGYKGRVHIAFGAELQGLADKSPDEIAADIDKQIIENYQLRPSHFLALAKLRELSSTGHVDLADVKVDAEHFAISENDKQVFEKRLATVEAKLHPHYLLSYANPVISRYRKHP